MESFFGNMPLAKVENLFSVHEAFSDYCLMVIPGSAFDWECNRMGYGKGYYDKYLDLISEKDAGLTFKIRSVGICFECQMQERIPVEAYDRKMDMVVTEKRIYER